MHTRARALIRIAAPRRSSLRRSRWLRLIGAACCVGVLAGRVGAPRAEDALTAPLSEVFVSQVDRRLAIPRDVQEAYGAALFEALRANGLWPLPSQFFVLVDRSRQVQVVMIFWQSGDGRLALVGATPCSTGLPGRFEYFETPVGVYDHIPANPDFRAEGTYNEQGIRGYGEKGMRVFDFGWVKAVRGWGDHHLGEMRLQMHATDPEHLEQRLGSACSKGCIRIPASLDVFIDRYGILDAEYDRAADAGARLPVLRADRIRTPWPGRYLVVVDSGRTTRPVWTRPARRP
ncbi:MAG: murein L,D-transpeptidase [Betaproteobacteria bacterium]|nr:murein L,D-transpeptidase [Betaproteobacteria bacterium]